MNYSKITDGIFVKRPNRFLAYVLVDGEKKLVHLKNAGRCTEILKTGTPVLLNFVDNPLRKTQFSLISAYKDENLINIDSQITIEILLESIANGKIEEFRDIISVKRDYPYKSSKFDIFFERSNSRGFIEVKSVTLEDDGIAMFPDSPTLSGTKHINKLIDAVENGYEGYIFFLVQMEKVSAFTPNKQIDPMFNENLKKAQEKGINLLAYNSILTRNSIDIGEKIEIIFK